MACSECQVLLCNVKFIPSGAMRCGCVPSGAMWGGVRAKWCHAACTVERGSTEDEPAGAGVEASALREGRQSCSCYSHTHLPSRIPYVFPYTICLPLYHMPSLIPSAFSYIICLPLYHLPSLIPSVFPYAICLHLYYLPSLIPYAFRYTICLLLYHMPSVIPYVFPYNLPLMIP